MFGRIALTFETMRMSASQRLPILRDVPAVVARADVSCNIRDAPHSTSDDVNMITADAWQEERVSSTEMSLSRRERCERA